MDFRALNTFIVYHKFWIVSLQNILLLLKKGIWMATLDLQDAYFHLRILCQHRQYLHFATGEDHFQYKVLPFGFSTAPRVFTKTMVVVTAHLRLLGVSVFPYIDDWLLVANSEDLLLKNIQITLSLLQTLGLCINHKKS
ncbi:PREDICTED: RNA-directed DNA polymerase homolog [Gekko japonicus]|uniref:ribonuclease H n=1 Tax=Gekko japonicus TaxID=146911 RepID=A0ABM1LDR5_GEKJA|nr:PREDICTED: RNA-directed DNA polymerase homolog [Gekko japonicus]